MVDHIHFLERIVSSGNTLLLIYPLHVALELVPEGFWREERTKLSKILNGELLKLPPYQ
jgi:hypothetical protein